MSLLSLHSQNPNDYSNLETKAYNYLKLGSIMHTDIVIKYPFLRTSFKKTDKSVSDVINETLPNTIILAISSILIAIIFGVFIGFLLVVTGATLGAVILFLIIKVGFIKSLESIQRKPGLLNKIKLGMEKDIWSYLFFIRFFPVFPFWFVNIAPAIVGVRFFPYLVTTFFGIMPGTLSIIMIGSGVEDIVNQKDDLNLNIFEQKKFMIGLLILSLISILPIFLKKFNLLKL